MPSQEELQNELDKQRELLSEAGERWLDAKASGHNTDAIDREADGYNTEIRRLEKLIHRRN